jgi:hypothetical protein
VDDYKNKLRTEIKEWSKSISEKGYQYLIIYLSAEEQQNLITFLKGNVFDKLKNDFGQER